MFPVYNKTSESQFNYALDNLASKLSSVFTLLDESPNIRYYASQSASGQSPKVLAHLVDKHLTEYAKTNPAFPSKTAFQQPTLLILDRGFDMLSPFTHEFSFQAMVQDLLDLENGKYAYKGERGKQLVELEEGDEVWQQIRHLHIAEAMEFLAEGVQKLQSNNKAAQWEMLQKNASQNQIDQISMMKETIIDLPQYQELKAKYAIYTQICEDCMAEYNGNALEAVAEVEQDIVTGSASNGKKPKNVWASLNALLQNPKVNPDDKLRLIVLYMVSMNGIPDQDRQQLMQAADLNLEETQALTNLSMFGVRLSQSYDSSRGNIQVGIFSFLCWLRWMDCRLLKMNLTSCFY